MAQPAPYYVSTRASAVSAPYAVDQIRGRILSDLGLVEGIDAVRVRLELAGTSHADRLGSTACRPGDVIVVSCCPPWRF